MAPRQVTTSPTLESPRLERKHHDIRKDHFAVLPREAKRRKQQRFQCHRLLPSPVQSKEAAKCSSSDARVARADQQEVLLCLPDIASGAFAVVVVETACARTADRRQSGDIAMTPRPGDAVSGMMHYAAESGFVPREVHDYLHRV